MQRRTSKPGAKKKVRRTTAKRSPLISLLDRQRKLLRPPAKAPLHVIKTLATIAKQLPGLAVAPGGSFAKGTSLKGSHDVDVFVRFPKGTADTTMSETLRRAFPKAAVLHGSRDYLQFKKLGIVYEVVPVHAVSHAGEIANVTDMSPLHVTYVQQHLTAAQKDDVRLLKRFCKAAGVYGAESHVRGFSGYVLELLVSHYGSFEAVLSAMTRWEGRVVLDPAHAYPNAQAALLRLNESKLGPLVLVDPLDAARNAAAAVSIESIMLLQERAASFLAQPNPSFFDPVVRPAAIRRAWKPAPVLFVYVKTPTGRQDIVGSRVLAAHERALVFLEASGFPLLHSEWRFDAKTSVAWYVLATTNMPKLTEQRGPPSSMPEAVRAFQAVHRNATERDGRWYAQVPRLHTAAHAALKAGWSGFRVKCSPVARRAEQKR